MGGGESHPTMHFNPGLSPNPNELLLLCSVEGRLTIEAVLFGLIRSNRSALGKDQWAWAFLRVLTLMFWENPPELRALKAAMVLALLKMLECLSRF